MSVSHLRRAGAVLFAVLVCGCSTSAPADRESPMTARDPSCLRNRASCMHEGSYDAGEREYAEQEAGRLNRSQLERLRRR